MLIAKGCDKLNDEVNVIARLENGLLKRLTLDLETICIIL